MRSRLVAAAATLAICGTLACTTGRRAGESAAVPHGWPVPRNVAVVTSNFGADRGRSRHEGIDLSAPVGTRVTATADGVVSTAGRQGDFGRLVVIDHDSGWQTRYAHLKSIKVKKGKRVTRGEVVGTVGKSGNATGSHLHYEIRHHGVPVDPSQFF
jgi:murein DD-endopeptidase MepM/ murein hydrolase activator NlpD